MAGRGGYDRGLSSAMSLVLRHGDRGKPMAVRADGLAHLDDLSHALDATPDAIMLVVQQSIKNVKRRRSLSFRARGAPGDWRLDPRRARPLNADDPGPASANEPGRVP